MRAILICKIFPELGPIRKPLFWERLPAATRLGRGWKPLPQIRSMGFRIGPKAKANEFPSGNFPQIRMMGCGMKIDERRKARRPFLLFAVRADKAAIETFVGKPQGD